MFDVFAKVQTIDAGLQAMQEAIALLKKQEVLIGIPEDANSREDNAGTPVNNAELLFIHTNGSPVNGIPARPVLEPAIQNDSERVAEMMKKAIDVAVDGNKGGVLPALEAAGQYGENIAKAWFTNPSNGWAKNSDVTIYGSNAYIRDGEPRPQTKANGEPYKLPEKPFIKGKGSARPLIDTGEMRKAITHVVKEV